MLGAQARVRKRARLVVTRNLEHLGGREAIDAANCGRSCSGLRTRSHALSRANERARQWLHFGRNARQRARKSRTRTRRTRGVRESVRLLKNLCDF